MEIKEKQDAPQAEPERNYENEQHMTNEMNRKDGEKRPEKKGKAVGSTGVKIVMFFLLVISFLIAAVSSVGTIALFEYDVYSNGRDGLADTLLYNRSRQDMYAVMDLYMYNQAGVDEYCQEQQIGVKIYKRNDQSARGRLVYDNYDGEETAYHFTMYTNWYNDNDKQEYYTVDIYISKDATSGAYGGLLEQMNLIYDMRYQIPVITVITLLLCMIFFVFLMCSAGHRNDREGIVPGVFTLIPLDVFTATFLILAGMGLVAAVLLTGSLPITLTIFSLMFIGVGEVILGTVYCMDVAVRLKMGGPWWRNTLIHGVFSLLGRIIRFICQGTAAMVRGLHLMPGILIVYLGICIFEAFGLSRWGSGRLVNLWILEKAVFTPVILYVGLVCTKLQQGGRALAEGNLNYHVNTAKMVGKLKEHGENLNRISDGISNAVEERMKSEHLKTELITNVSHDLKTPLTSIINYADLIGEEETDNEKITEYAKVLLRQSRRLKKLLEDLVEASKATTGNMEVNLQPCEIGVLLSQAVGEYQQRFAEKNLELLITQPEESMKILGDGRHLWRVLDNLLNNIYKYAQDNSRVYITVEPRDAQVIIVFRNMSKYALNITADELKERFARGDRSRHMDGNGLGLSIAGSLVDLQKGTMEIVTDGDLFKVVLTFDRIQG